VSLFEDDSSRSCRAVRKQNRPQHESSGCRQAKYFLHRPDHSRARFALNLARKDLTILVGLLTGHADLNLHLCIMGIRQDSGCPLCQEEGNTTVNLIAQCSALMILALEILLLHWIRWVTSIGFSSWGLPKIQRGSINLEVCRGQVETPGYVPKKNPVGFFGITHLKTHPKNPHFYFNLILLYTLYATKNAIFYCF